MANETNSVIVAVLRLLRLTQDGILKWSLASYRETPLDSYEPRVEGAYATKYKETYLRLTAQREYHPARDVTVTNDPYGLWSTHSSNISRALGLKVDDGKPYWSKEVYLQIVTESDRILWTFPKNQATHDLYNAVEYQVAGVNALVEELLKD